MKIKELLKKSLMLYLVFSVFASMSLSAAGPITFEFQKSDFGEFGTMGVHSFTNSDGSTTFGLGGRYQIKRTKPSFRPWFTTSAPEAKLGCGGFSFKGMFGNLIDTDQLKEQLSDAGGALAWGVLIGLIGSLPSVAKVFEWINKWARQLQNLLQDACNIGQKLVLKSDWGKNIRQASEDIKGSISSTSTELLKTLQQSTGDPLKEFTDFLNSDEASSEKKKVSLFTVFFGALSNGGFSLATGYLESKMNEVDASDFTKIQEAVEKYTTLAKADVVLPTNGVTTLEGCVASPNASESLYSYQNLELMLVRLLDGYTKVVMNKKAMADAFKIKDKAEAIEGAVSGATEAEEQKKMLKKIEHCDSGPCKSAVDGGANVEKLVSFVFEGNFADAFDSSSEFTQEMLSIVPNDFTLTVTNVNRGAETEKSIRFIPQSSKTICESTKTDYEDYLAKFPGFKALANAQVECILNYNIKSPIAVSDEGILNDKFRELDISKSDCEDLETVFPYLNSEINRKMSLVSKLPDKDKYELIDILKLDNQIAWIHMMNAIIKDVLNGAFTSTNSGIDSTNPITSIAINEILDIKEDLTKEVNASTLALRKKNLELLESIVSTSKVFENKENYTNKKSLSHTGR